MTVPAGVSILVFEATSAGQAPGILLGKRLGAHGCGQYAFPGGRLEPMESPRLCAARELWEETGMQLAESRLQPWAPCPYVNGSAGGEPWLTLFFFVQLTPLDPPPMRMEPTRCAGWRFCTELPLPLFMPAQDCLDVSRQLDSELLKGIYYATCTP